MSSINTCGDAAPRRPRRPRRHRAQVMGHSVPDRVADLMYSGLSAEEFGWILDFVAANPVFDGDDTQRTGRLGWVMSGLLSQFPGLDFPVRDRLQGMLYGINVILRQARIGENVSEITSSCDIAAEAADIAAEAADIAADIADDIDCKIYSLLVDMNLFYKRNIGKAGDLFVFWKPFEPTFSTTIDEIRELIKEQKETSEACREAATS
ncbi:hypothetical protein BJ170DRAFT_678969 [Xylariales sp. AK1849]|nr:hypothetical protein BJ170DRAFT_678969 [Xylariales sp. AK1849]